MVGVVNITDLNDVFVPAERLKQISGRDALLGTTNSMNVNLPNNEQEIKGKERRRKRINDRNI